ncbi:MAG: DUF3095 family protein, partial [Rhodobiaceae bacterium]|nr:DUF3095 family protein [Rhodobiaceae bacterium]
MDATSERAPLTSFSTFSQVVEPSVYTPLPDDWLVGMTDVEDSTGAIAAGRYKAVNMAGAAAISAVMNALDHAPFPFIFGGDGTAFAVPPEFGDIAANALARTAAFVRDDLSLNLRVAMVPVSTIRAAGHDVLVGWYAVSDAVRYAVFSGGGLTWAEAEMKAGRFHLPAARPEDRPDLTGLSCRWNRIGAAKGTILSLIVRPQPGADRDAFATLVRRILDLLSAAEREGHPVPSEGPGFRWPPRGCRMEALATKGEQSTLTRMAAIVAIGFLAAVLDKTGRTLGRFDPKHYRRQTALNTDFRKFD